MSSEVICAKQKTCIAIHTYYQEGARSISSEFDTANSLSRTPDPPFPYPPTSKWSHNFLPSEYYMV